MKINKGLKVNRGEDMDSLYESMEYDFECGADIIDSLRRINKVPKKDWVKVLEGFKKWELRELGENSEWDKDCLDKESIEFIEKNKIKWNWMY